MSTPPGNFTPAGATPLRLCAVGQGQWLGHNSPSFGSRFFCPKHLRELFEGFDPQPFREGGTNSDQTVRMIDGGFPTPDTPYVVLERQGDWLKLRQLGMREREPVWHRIGAVWPHRYMNFTKGCGND